MTVWQRMWSGRRWRGVLRRAVSAGVLALLASATLAAPATAYRAETTIEQMTIHPTFSEHGWYGGGAETALWNRAHWFRTRGSLTGYSGPLWYVSYIVDGAEDSKEFYSEAEALAFADSVEGPRIEPSWEHSEQPDVEGQLLLEADGTPVVEIIASTGTVLYASPSVRRTPEDGAATPPPETLETDPNTGWSTRVGLPDGVRVGDVEGADLVVSCTYEEEATRLAYGRGLLEDVRPLPAGATFRACGFRSTAMLARMRQVTWQRHLAVGATAVGGIGVGAAVLVGGVAAIAERVRRRAVVAAAADLPELVAGSGPMAGLTDGVNVSLARARSAVEQQRGFVADAAHELRSPLSSLITTLEVAERYPHLTDQRSVTAASLKQARRIERLTQDLLTLAQVDARVEVRQDSVALDDLIRDVADDHRGQGRDVRIDAPAPATVVGDPEALRRVLANLVGNAVRHARREVTITLLTWPDRVDVTVADDGSGIAAIEHERIFDRFTRLDEARGRDAGGSGLGLSIARELARRHGGDVTLDRPGRSSGGAVFRLTLPTAR